MPGSSRFGSTARELDEASDADVAAKLADVHGLIVGPGFGARGTEGKIKSIRYAREHDLPFFGICYGMQMAVIEFARNVCSLQGANTEEVAPQTPHPVIHLLPEQRDISDKGASMRLGAYPCRLVQHSLAARLYDAESVEERHRHRYEVNNEYREQMTRAGLGFSGVSPDYQLVEIIEIPSHPYFGIGDPVPASRVPQARPQPRASAVRGPGGGRAGGIGIGQGRADGPRDRYADRCATRSRAPETDHARRSFSHGLCAHRRDRQDVGGLPLAVRHNAGLAPEAATLRRTKACKACPA